MALSRQTWPIRVIRLLEMHDVRKTVADERMLPETRIRPRIRKCVHLPVSEPVHHRGIGRG